MEFNLLHEILPKIVNEPLPGAAAHAKMAPLGRLPSLEPGYYSQFNPRPSAILMLCYPIKGTAHLVLIKRNTYEGIHSAQISFPGGKQETFDAGLEQTALRETNEELGIPISAISIVKGFSEIYIPPSNFLVMPYLGLCTTQPDFLPDPAEVAQVIELPLERLIDDAFVIEAELETSYSKLMTVPAFQVDNHIVWGATAMMLSELKETIKNALK
jgi:8-oxo-dGTP pyrophosphatase MutT (NUDIX family)